MWVGAEVEAWWGGEWYEARMVAELDGRSQQGAAVLIHYVGGRRARCLPFSPHPTSPLHASSFLRGSSSSAPRPEMAPRPPALRLTRLGAGAVGPGLLHPPAPAGETARRLTPGWV